MLPTIPSYVGCIRGGLDNSVEMMLSFSSVARTGLVTHVRLVLVSIRGGIKRSA